MNSSSDGQAGREEPALRAKRRNRRGQERGTEDFIRPQTGLLQAFRRSYAPHSAVVTLTGGKMKLTNKLEGNEGEGDATIAVAEASMLEGLESFSIKGLSFDAQTKVYEEFTSFLGVNFDELSDNGSNKLTDGKLKYKVSGIDGKAFAKILAVFEEAGTAGRLDDR